jgi:hypothetical protein
VHGVVVNWTDVVAVELYRHDGNNSSAIGVGNGEILSGGGGGIECQGNHCWEDVQRLYKL